MSYAFLAPVAEAIHFIPGLYSYSPFLAAAPVKMGFWQTSVAFAPIPLASLLSPFQNHLNF